jgi:hypothetical protein
MNHSQPCTAAPAVPLGMLLDPAEERVERAGELLGRRERGVHGDQPGELLRLLPRALPDLRDVPGALR